MSEGSKTIISVEERRDIIESREVLSLTVNNNYLEDTDLICTAGEDLGGHKVVYLKNDKVYKADRNNIDCFNKVIGMTANAAVAGEDVVIKKGTRIELIGWELIENALYYLGADGGISDSSTDGIFQIIGIAKNPNTLLIQLSNAIFRGS
jgi:hypothetical protein